MMGLYFAASGLGNKLAANIGENAGDAGEGNFYRNFCRLFIVWSIGHCFSKPAKTTFAWCRGFT